MTEEDVNMFDGDKRRLLLSEEYSHLLSQNPITSPSNRKQLFNTQTLNDEDRPQTSEMPYEVRRVSKKKEPMQLSMLTPAQIGDHYPEIFEDWHLQKQMAEGVRIGSRLRQDMKIVSKAQEKESWAGIQKMNLDNLDPNAAYKNYRLENRKFLHRQGGMSSKNIATPREQKRKEIIKQIKDAVISCRESEAKQAQVEEQKIQEKYYQGKSLEN